jgi:hypothetical protein
LLPAWFHGDTGTWVRVVIRFAVAGVLWNMLRLFLRAQRVGRLRIAAAAAASALESPKQFDPKE